MFCNSPKSGNYDVTEFLMGTVNFPYLYKKG